MITRYVTEEPSRRKRDVQQKLETTFTDLVTTFDHGRPIVSTRRHTVTLGMTLMRCVVSFFFSWLTFARREAAASVVCLCVCQSSLHNRLRKKELPQLPGTLHITDTVHLPATTRLEPAVTRIVEPALVREHVPIDPRPVDHTYYTTYTYFTTTLSHGVPVTKTRYVSLRCFQGSPSQSAALHSLCEINTNLCKARRK